MPTFAAPRHRVLDNLVRVFVLIGFVALAETANAATPGASAPDSNWTTQLRSPQVQKFALSLARRAMTQFLKNGSTLQISGNVPSALKRRAGVFVTIEKRGQVTPRGCRGTLQPIMNTLAEEIVRNAIAAAIRDAHQPKLRREELSQTRLSLTIVVRVQPISNINQHDAQNNGLIAQNGSRIGVVLPFEGRDAWTQLDWARRKAGIKTNESAQLSELFAVRFRE